MSSKLKIAFCTDGIFPHAVGGMQRHSFLLIEELAKHQEVELIVLHPHQGVKCFPDFENVREIVVPPLPNKRYYLFELYDYSKAIYQELKKLGNDYVIYSQGFSVWYGIDELKNRLIVNPHGLEPWQVLTMREKLSSFPLKWAQKRIFRKARHTVSLGGSLTHILRDQAGLSSSQVVVLPNATEIKEDLKYLERSFKLPLEVLFVGRFAFNKGIDIFLQAIEQLEKEGIGNQFIFHFVGKGPLYDEYSQKYHFSNVKFWGFVDDAQLNELYQTSHLFALPTLFEGMPTVVLESMKYSLPIVVTDVGATRVLVDETNGFIIEKRSAQSLVDTLKTFLHLPVEQKQALAKKSFQKVIEQFSWKTVALAHIALFKEVLKSQN